MSKTSGRIYISIQSKEEILLRLQDIRGKMNTSPAECIALLTELEAVIPEDYHTELIELYNAQAHCYIVLEEYPAAREVAQNGINLLAEKIPTGVEYGSFLKALGDIDFAQGHYAGAAGYYEKTLGIYRRHEYMEGIASCLVCLGNCHVARGDFKNGFHSYSEGLAASRHVRHTDSEISALIGQSNAYIFMGRYAEALEMLHRALLLSEETGDTRRIVSATINIGLAFKKTGKLDQALDYYQRALQLITTYGDRKNEGTALLNIGAIYYEKGEKDEALTYFLKSLDVQIKHGNIAGQAICFNNIGSVYTEIGRLEEALDFLLKSLDIRKSTKNIRGEAITLSAIGKLMHISGKTEHALDYLTRSIEIAEKANMPELEHEARMELVKVLKARQSYEEAILHAELGFEAYKKIFNSEAEAKAATLRIQFETEQAIKDSETERIKNAELAQANAKLIALSNERNEFIAMAAHDLKNPLHSIKMLLNFIQNTNSDLADSVQENLLEIKTSVVDMLDLIQKLLDTETIESGGIQLRRETFRSAEIIREVLKRYETAGKLKNITFHQELDPTVTIFTDVRYLLQVVDNVISNAVKYSPPGGNITVRVLKRDSNMRVEVQDEGQGLLPTEINQLFVKFRRLSPRPTGGENSTGLGLFIARRLTEAMNGNIWCESEPGCGSIFIIEFPAMNF